MLFTILKLILSHLIGDFFLQPYKWVEKKQVKKIKSIWLYVHVLVHIAVMFFILWNLEFWWLILLVGFSHLVVDALKLIFQNNKNKRYLFFIDQLLHLICIVGFSLVYFKDSVVIATYFDESVVLFLICVLFLTQPASLFMKTIFSKWQISDILKENDTLKDAGMYIGILERILVFVFIVLGQWSAIGFLITAKSVFRFGDIAKAKERKLTEYMLIGTLLSFGMAIFVGIIFSKLINY